MAEHADGSIIVDTEIDAQGFKSDSSELQRAIKSLNTKIQSLGPTFQKAVSGNANAVSTFNAKASALENTISEIKGKMQSLAGTQVPTDDYQWLTNEIQKANNELSKLYERQEKMEAIGVKKDSAAWKSLQYDIDLAKRKVSEYTAEQSAMRNSGTAFQSGVNTAQYKQLEAALVSAKNKLAQMRTEASAANSTVSRLATVGNAVKSAMNGIGNVTKKAFSKLGSAVKSGITKMRQFSKHTNNASFSMNSLSGRIKMMIMMIKQMLVMSAFMSILKAIGEGLQNLSQYSSQTNKDLSALKSSLTQLKNSFTSAFAPVLTAVTPILTTLINYLSAAITYIGKFVAALTGAKTFTKATAVQEDYAASLNETGAAAEKAQNQLAGFDKMNVLNDNSSSSGGSSGGAVSPSEMFEEVPIESKILDFTENLKKAFKNGDYAGVGQIIGSGINTAVQKINDYISWDSVGTKITTGIKAVAQCFNSVVDTVNWENIGDTLAQGLNTAVNTLFLVITEFDWPGLSFGFARSLNGFVSGIDWAKLGTTISAGLKTAIATLRSAVETFDWNSLGSGIAEGLNSIDFAGIFGGISGTLSSLIKGVLDGITGFAKEFDWNSLGSGISEGINNIDFVGIFGSLAGTLSGLLKGALEGLTGLAQGINWSTLGTDLWTSITAMLNEIDWSGIISSAFELLGTAVAGLSQLIAGFALSVWESIKEGFESIKEQYFEKYMNEYGELTIEGFFKGISDMLKDIGKWIVENIFNPFIEGFKSAFGIHSPSTVMEEQGGYVISGLWEGIKGAWHNITDFFSEKTEALKTTLSEAWGQIKTDVSEKFSEVKENLSETWENVKTTASETWEELSSTLSESWESIKMSASEKFEKLRGNISTAWGSVKTDASVKWEEISTTVSDKWESIKTTATDKFGEIKGKISDKWDEVKKSASTKWEEISSELNGKADSIKTMFSKKDWASIGSNICSGIKEGIKDGWSWLTDTVSSVASNLLSSAKETLGIHSPSRLFHDIIGLNIGYGIGEGIKDSEPSVIGTVSDVADAIAAEFSNGDYSISGNYAENGIDGAVMTFSDTITDEISELMNKLQTIADNVSFVVPAMAEGTIVPYGTSKKQIKEQYDSAIPAASSADTIKQALFEVLGSQSGGDINLTIELDGDVVYKTIVRKNRQNTRLTGVNALGY